MPPRAAVTRYTAANPLLHSEHTGKKPRQGQTATPLVGCGTPCWSHCNPPLHTSSCLAHTLREDTAWPQCTGGQTEAKQGQVSRSRSHSEQQQDRRDTSVCAPSVGPLRGAESQTRRPGQARGRVLCGTTDAALTRPDAAAHPGTPQALCTPKPQETRLYPHPCHPRSGTWPHHVARTARIPRSHLQRWHTGRPRFPAGPADSGHERQESGFKSASSGVIHAQLRGTDWGPV